MPRSAPSLARNLLTLELLVLDTHILAPSKRRLVGFVAPLLNTPNKTPPAALIFERLSSSAFATQIFAPSKVTSVGMLPTFKLPCGAPSLARNFATLSLPELATQMFV